LEKTALSHVIFISQVDKSFKQKVLDFINIEIEMQYLKKNITDKEIFDTRFLGD
jgi:hypothetical protein